MFVTRSQAHALCATQDCKHPSDSILHKVFGVLQRIDASANKKTRRRTFNFVNNFAVGRLNENLHAIVFAAVSHAPIILTKTNKYAIPSVDACNFNRCYIVRKPHARRTAAVDDILRQSFENSIAACSAAVEHCDNSIKKIAAVIIRISESDSFTHINLPFLVCFSGDSPLLRLLRLRIGRWRGSCRAIST